MMRRYNFGKPYIVKRTIKGYFEPLTKVSGEVALEMAQNEPYTLPPLISMSAQPAPVDAQPAPPPDNGMNV